MERNCLADDRRCPHVLLCEPSLLNNVDMFEKRACSTCVDEQNDGNANELTSLLLQIQDSHSTENGLSNPLETWVCCNSNCDFQGCRLHAIEHFEYWAHPIGMNLISYTVTCFQCGFDLPFKASKNSPDPNGRVIALPMISTHKELWPPLVYERSIDGGEGVPGLVGLLNSSSTCFANAVIQCLSNCAPMTLHILSDPTPSTPIMLAYRAVLFRLWVKPFGSFPASLQPLCDQIFKRSLSFQFEAQHDAQEFLRCLLDHIHHCEMSQESTLCGQNSKENPTLIQHLFNGTISSSVKCLSCNNVSRVTESFEDLSLPVLTDRERQNDKQLTNPKLTTELKTFESLFNFSILSIIVSWFKPIMNFLRFYIPNQSFSNAITSLNDLLDAYMKPEILTGDNMYRCDRCQALSEGLREYKFVQLPEILSIHFKRFRQDNVDLPRKLQNHITYSHELDLTNFVDRQRCKDTIFRYELFGIICHEGYSNGGHYIAYCRNFFDGSWYEFNDVNVIPVSPLSVLKKQAYLLFYQKQYELPSDIRFKLLRDQFQLCCSGDGTPNGRLVSRRFLNDYFLTSEDTTAKYKTNHLLCEHGLILPRLWNQMNKLTVNVPEQIIDALWDQTISLPVDIGPCLECLNVDQVLVRKSRAEYATFKKLMTASSSSSSTVRISTEWIKAWEKYVADALHNPRPRVSPHSGEPSIEITSAAFNFLRAIH
ncbi:hypothetical protein ACOME3_009159 [Neoechinorhynchus agilis]